MNNTPHTPRWNKENVLPKLKEIRALVKKEGTFPFISSVLKELDLSRRTWLHWKGKFDDNEEISELMAVIETICEAALYEGAMKGDYPATLAVLGLKYNHRWHDKMQTEDKPYDPEEGVWIVLDEERRYKIG